MTEIEFEGKIFRLSADGFVPLATFSKELFDLSPEDIGSFFDSDYRFYKKYENIRHKLRHNVRFTKNRRNGTLNIVCEGGIYCDDFQEFIRRARQSIAANNQAFDQAVLGWKDNSQNSAVNQKTSFLALKLARLLRLVAHLLRLMTK